ncbi:MAG: hypothetical protein KIT77_12130 [Caldilinea sp.]|nr:hypothetical protein [Caldilinea sp.]
MSTFLAELLNRTVHPAPLVTPRLPARFELPAAVPGAAPGPASPPHWAKEVTAAPSPRARAARTRAPACCRARPHQSGVVR